MAVGSPGALEYEPVAGIELAAVASHIRYRERLDLALLAVAEGSTTAGVFTQNAFCAAPVVVCRQHLSQESPRYLLINSGNANAGTGQAGLAAARDCCQQLADIAGVGAQQILPFSTGVIGETLPLEKIRRALPKLHASLAADGWADAAAAILTTDTRPKLSSRQLMLDGKTVTITGMAKGAGMIKPNMATMLGFVATDAKIERQFLDSLLRTAVERSFNRITVDGDTSTNDACMLIATGRSGVTVAAERESFSQALMSLFQELATGLIRDAEGASKFVTITVRGGASDAECLRVAYCVAESPLVKTAFFSSDPNWGRILAAIGRSGVERLDIEQVSIHLGDTALVVGGEPDPQYSEARGQAAMSGEEIDVTIDLGRGTRCQTVWTSDLSHDYVRINADYRS